MMALNEFTPNQQKAITSRDKTLLVSAGAGSGKTTVLTRRLIERIKQGGDIRRFLVVTFMKAAASDIKSKLYDALLEAMADDPKSDHLYNQSLLVPEANICTISSYCLGLVKENFALLGISPHVRVIDEIESEMLLRRAADEIMSEYYNNEDTSFLLVADNFSGEKGDEPLVQAMLRLYNALRVTMQRDSLLKACAESLGKSARVTIEKGFFESEIGKELYIRIERVYLEHLDAVYQIHTEASLRATDEKYLKPIEKMVELAEHVYSCLRAKDYNAFCNAAKATTEKIQLSSSGCDKADREIIKDLKKELTDSQKEAYNRYCRGSEKFIAESLTKCADIVKGINKFLEALETRYEALKQEMGVLDYTDFEEKALLLLETTDSLGNAVPTELCLKKRGSFDEILIDEYQDVNPLQDKLFRLLASGSHRFMVGDVKQSIYRFRNAYPDIFLGYKEDFPDIDCAENSETAKIYLRENFRCSNTVIQYVNHLFEILTKDTQYEKEYKGEGLIHAKKGSEFTHPVTIAIAEKETERGKGAIARQNEADYIAREILRLVNKETDDNGNPLRFSDCAVMLSAMKGYSIEYEKAFNKYGIPYKKEKSESFLENNDIKLAIAAMKAVDDPTDDISLCALMRSPIANFNSSDLYCIRLNKPQVSFWEALLAFAEIKNIRIKGKCFKYTRRRGESLLTLRCRSFIKRLFQWRVQSAGISCFEFLKSFLVSSGLLRISEASGSKESMLLLFEYSRKFETSSTHGLSGFLDYIEELARTGKSISDAAKTGEENAVSFITVHKSKGLEFKVCFLAGTEKQFMGMRASAEITVLRREGIYFRLNDRNDLTSYNPICNILAFEKEREAALGEELRKLYVALTRAKERLYITGCREKGKEIVNYTPLTAKSLLELICYVSSQGDRDFFNVVNILDSDGETGYIPQETKKLIPATQEMLSAACFEYSYVNAVKTPAKISVSELREGLLEDDEYNRNMIVPMSRISKKPAFMEKQKSHAQDIGTANHLFMQFCDFKSAETDLSKEADRLVNIKMLTTAQREMLNLPALEQFFKSELYESIKNSKKVYREKRFSIRMLLPNQSEPILVQGVIDCFFQNPDGSYTVVDYKTDRIPKLSDLAERHRFQLYSYCDAVARMTDKPVSSAVLYSFHLNDWIDVK